MLAPSGINTLRSSPRLINSRSKTWQSKLCTTRHKLAKLSFALFRETPLLSSGSSSGRRRAMSSTPVARQINGLVTNVPSVLAAIGGSSQIVNVPGAPNGWEPKAISRWATETVWLCSHSGGGKQLRVVESRPSVGYLASLSLSPPSGVPDGGFL